jgi:hypothetical protein
VIVVGSWKRQKRLVVKEKNTDAKSEIASQVTPSASPAPTQKRNKRFTARAFVAVLTAMGFFGLAVSGLVLYIEPHGRVAYWTWWRFWGLNKDQWDAFHIVFGWVFVFAGAFHLYFNWRPFKRYLYKKLKKGVRMPVEGIAALALTLFLFLGSVFRLPPVSFLLDLNDYAKRTWMGRVENVPPFGHAEMKTLAMFCRLRGIDLKAAVTRLQKGLQIQSVDQTIAQIARHNNITPAKIYLMIRDLEPADLSRRGIGRGAGGGQGMGRGLGRGMGRGRGGGRSLGRGMGRGRGGGRSLGRGMGRGRGGGRGLGRSER